LSEIQTEPAGTAGQGEPEPKPTGKTFTEDEFNSHAAKLRKAEEAKRTKLEAELTALREAQKTEGEKQLDRVRQEVSAEWAAKLQAHAVDAELKVKLIERGLPANAVHLVKAENEIGSTEEIDAAIDATLRANEWLKPGKAIVPSQGGSPRGSGGSDEFSAPWTDEKVLEIRRRGLWAKYKDSIGAALGGGQ